MGMRGSSDPHGLLLIGTYPSWSVTRGVPSDVTSEPPARYRSYNHIDISSETHSELSARSSVLPSSWSPGRASIPCSAAWLGFWVQGGVTRACGSRDEGGGGVARSIALLRRAAPPPAAGGQPTLPPTAYLLNKGLTMSYNPYAIVGLLSIVIKLDVLVFPVLSRSGVES